MSTETKEVKNNIRRFRRRENVESVRYFDYSLTLIMVLLLAFGLLMLYSSSSYIASLEYGDPARYLKRQVFAVMVGIVGLIFFVNINYFIVEKFATLFFIFSTALSILVIFLGTAQGTSSRWFYVGPISVQPSELVKVGIIVFIASQIYRHPKEINDPKFLGKLFLYILPAFIAVAYNNLSTAVIIFGIAFVMLFIAGRQYLLFGSVLLFGLALIAFYIAFAGYRSDRIAIWMDPAGHPRGGQVIQGLYAIGSGGLFGKGLGESIQKQGFVPETQNDMVFSIIVEELGLVGALMVIVMYMLLIWRLFVIAMNSKDLFGSFTVVGIIVHISAQVILNIAVVTNTIPNTGVTLPFISYGGTSISILVAEMGLALGISRGIYLK